MVGSGIVPRGRWRRTQNGIERGMACIFNLSVRSRIRRRQGPYNGWYPALQSRLGVVNKGLSRLTS